MKAKEPSMANEISEPMLPGRATSPGMAPTSRSKLNSRRPSGGSPSAMMLLPQELSLYLHLPETLSALQPATAPHAAEKTRMGHQRSATFDATRTKNLVAPVIVAG